MANALISQSFIEVAISPTSPIYISQSFIEVVISPTSPIYISQSFIEVSNRTVANIYVSQLGIESLTINPFANVNVSQLGIEVLSGGEDIPATLYVSQLGIEILTKNPIFENFASNFQLNSSLITFSEYLMYLNDEFKINSYLSTEYVFTLEEIFGLNSIFSTKDFVIKWSCRTKIPNMAFGGEMYGGGQGYGGGQETDIVKFYIEVHKSSNMQLLRYEFIDILDFENPDYTYVYPYNINLLDNGGSFNNSLTFIVYQVDRNGNYSLSKILTT